MGSSSSAAGGAEAPKPPVTAQRAETVAKKTPWSTYALVTSGVALAVIAAVASAYGGHIGHIIAGSAALGGSTLLVATALNIKQLRGRLFTHNAPRSKFQFQQP